MELDERICRAILKNAWDTAAADKDEGEMPEFPEPKVWRDSDGVRRWRRTFYREYLYHAINDLPYYLKE